MVGAKGVGELQRKQQEALEVSWKLGELGRLAGSVFGPGREIGRGATMQWWCMVLSYPRKQRALEKESSPVRGIKSRVPVARGSCAT